MPNPSRRQSRKPPARSEEGTGATPTADAQARATLAELMTGTPTPSPTSLAPPQGPGAPRRLRIEGAPAGQERLNAAMKVLLDPIARTRASRVYSGQARDWNR